MYGIIILNSYFANSATSWTSSTKNIDLPSSFTSSALNCSFCQNPNPQESEEFLFFLPELPVPNITFRPEPKPELLFFLLLLLDDPNPNIESNPEDFFLRDSV